jgi:hypothetical protein
MPFEHPAFGFDPVFQIVTVLIAALAIEGVGQL